MNHLSLVIDDTNGWLASSTMRRGFCCCHLPALALALSASGVFVWSWVVASIGLSMSVIVGLAFRVDVSDVVGV